MTTMTEMPVVTTTNVIEIKFHPAADVFPLLDGEPFDALVADIKAHGLREPIVLHPDGRILDGRNRYHACIEAGVAPSFRTWEGDAEDGVALLAYVLSLNLHRRHLDASQRCMVAARIANMRQGARTDLAQNCAMSQTQAAELLNVSRRGVQLAREVLDHGTPDDICGVEQGIVPVSVAAKEVHARINEPRNKLKREKGWQREAANRAQRKAGGPSDTDFASKGSTSTTEGVNREAAALKKPAPKLPSFQAKTRMLDMLKSLAKISSAAKVSQVVQKMGRHERKSALVNAKASMEWLQTLIAELERFA